MLQHNESKNTDIIVNFTEKFFQEYDTLKNSEKWKDIIDLGLKALEDSQIIDKD